MAEDILQPLEEEDGIIIFLNHTFYDRNTVPLVLQVMQATQVEQLVEESEAESSGSDFGSVDSIYRNVNFVRIC